MALSAAERQRRSRAHKRGDHSLCDPERCADVTAPVTAVAEPAVTEAVTDVVLAELGGRGRRLYLAVVQETPELGARQRVILEEAARTADRLETLDRLLRGDERVWARVYVPEVGDPELVVDKTLAEARQQQGILARLLSELRQSLAPADAKPGPGAQTTPASPTDAGGKLLDLTQRLKDLHG